MTMTTKRRRSPTLLGLLCLAGAWIASPADAEALSADQAVTSASEQIGAAIAGIPARGGAIRAPSARERSPAQRIADAVLLLGSKDFQRASTVLNEIIEKYPSHPTAYPDALALLGETYFR